MYVYVQIRCTDQKNKNTTEKVHLIDHDHLRKGSLGDNEQKKL